MARTFHHQPVAAGSQFLRTHCAGQHVARRKQDEHAKIGTISPGAYNDFMVWKLAYR